MSIQAKEAFKAAKALMMENIPEKHQDDLDDFDDFGDFQIINVEDAPWSEVDVDKAIVMLKPRLHKAGLETEIADRKKNATEELETEIFQEHLGLREDFFIPQNWNEKDFDFKTAIKQALRYNQENIDFEESQENSHVLEKIGFDCNMAKMLSKTFGPEIQDPNLLRLRQEIQSFIQLRLDAVVVSHPDWSKTPQIFEVFNSKENQKKQYQSILIPWQKGLHGSNESLKMLIGTALGDPSTTETWYHATTATEALEIMKNGFSFTNCMKNRNFSHMDGIYFTDSITSAKQLFHYNSIIDPIVYPGIKYRKKKASVEQTQYKIVVLAFTYHKEENNLLEKYKWHSIDLRDHVCEERLKKIVNFFSKDPLPTSHPTVEEHGLCSDYEDYIEYIIGPHVIISSSKVCFNRSLTQLCIRCVGRKSMKNEFENLIQKEVFVLDVNANDLCK
jgi:hypothetical protein